MVLVYCSWFPGTCCRWCFSLEVRPLIYAHLFLPQATKKQHFVEEGLTNEGRHNLLLLYKQADDKRGIADSLHAYTTRARPTEFEVGVFSTES